MIRNHMVVLMALVLAVPAAAASAGFFSASRPEPCLQTGGGAYQISGDTSANYTVRVDGDTAHADLHIQIVDDPASADFDLVDDGDADACRDVGTIRSIRVDPTAAKPDMTVALSNRATEGGYKIYVRSASFSEQDTAALFAVIWKNTSGREFLARR
jgi:hypothetical protein